MPNYEELSPDMGPVGANIFRIRRKLRITQKQLAAPEFSISYISAIERGRIRPSLKALEILARRLGLTSPELLAEPPHDFDLETRQTPQDTAAPPPSLTTLLSRSRSTYLSPPALIWASISLDQHNPHSASEILNLLSPTTISTEQRLLRLYLLGRVALALGRPADAEATLEPIFQQDEYSSHTEIIERCRFLLACAYDAQEKFVLAFDTFTTCVQAIENGAISDPLFLIEVFSAFAEYHHRRERPNDAIACYQQALLHLDPILEPARLAEISAHLSQKHLESLHSTMSDWYAARSRVLIELAEARQRFTQAASNLGLTFQELGDPTAAEQQLRQTIHLCERLGTPRQGILARVALADLLLERQEPQEAENLALAAHVLARPNDQDDIQDETLYGRILVTLADTNRAMNRLDEAERCFQQAIALLKKQNASEQLSHAYYRYSELLHQKGLDAESYEMVKQAYLLGQRKRDDETGT
ncbi:MAG TPA: tetratricopeptide repeat protein [Ktedonobacterales bacterium]|jgi:tetratricopeptide (TPR) repeat protein/transcriptional regulator with XRE-family HTH domain